jgi:site-specific recombinase XerD
VEESIKQTTEAAMEVVYLFYESGTIRIPFFDYDQRLFRMLVSVGGGVWDNTRKEFVFRRNENMMRFSGIASYIPYVQVLENVVNPIRISGLRERQWPEIPDTRPIKKRGEDTVFAMPVAPPLPDKFSKHWQDQLEAELRARKYSPKTMRSYIYYNSFLCRTLQKTPEEIRPDDITQFLAIIEKDREYSASSLNLAISGIKFFYSNVMKNEGISEPRRPRHDKRLPQVLSKEEIQKILALEKNPKHRLLLMLVYSSGLRVSEVVALKREHIDMSRKVIYIKRGKGRKDRCTLLSEKAACFLNEYYTFYGIQTWLFPGQPATSPLTIRSAQHIFDNAVRRAAIPKKLSIHSLRHTFATHLLESGTDIRYIQSLLGHATLRTTERYTHIARRNVLSIQSPLDSIP